MNTFCLKSSPWPLEAWKHENLDLTKKNTGVFWVLIIIKAQTCRRTNATEIEVKGYKFKKKMQNMELPSPCSFQGWSLLGPTCQDKRCWIKESERTSHLHVLENEKFGKENHMLCSFQEKRNCSPVPERYVLHTITTRQAEMTPHPSILWEVNIVN